MIGGTLMSDSRNDKLDTLYFAIIPRDPRTTKKPQFLVSWPAQLEELKENQLHWQKLENCQPEDVIILELHMPLEKFLQMRDELRATYLYEDTKDKIVKENNKYKSLTEKSADAIASELIKNPATPIYKREKITEEVYELVVKSLGNFLNQAETKKKESIQKVIDQVKEENEKFLKP